MGYTHLVLRRSIEHPTIRSIIKRATEDGPKLDVPVWGQVIVGLTLLITFIAVSALEFTLKDVVATLSMVETPSAAITVSSSEEAAPKNDSKDELLETGPTINLVHQKPITTSIRGTIRHIVSIGGRFARWRGFKLSMLYSITYTLLASVFQSVIPRFVPCPMIFASAISGALLSGIHATWTHKVISMPTEKSLRERFTSASNFKVLAVPAAVSAAAQYVTVYLDQGFIMVFGLDRLEHEDLSNYSGAQWASVVLRFVAMIIIIIASALFIILPAKVTLIRTEASILPEDQDTIVPFDRSFAGKVVPKILGGTGAIKFFDAWRSFNWEARGRLIKLYLKITAILFAVIFVAMHVLLVEVYFIMGPAINKYVNEMQRDGRPIEF